MMMSRNERPSRASTSDFGCCSPIVVASPPFSLITATRASARAGSAAGSSANVFTSPAGSSSAVRSTAGRPCVRRSYALPKFRIASSD